MKFGDLLQTARGGLRRSKARTFLTITAVFIGAMTLTLTNGIGTGVKSYLSQQISEFGAKNVMQVVPKGSDGPGKDSPTPYNPNRKVSSEGRMLLNQKDIATIKSVPNITEVEPNYIFSPDYVMGKAGKFQLSNVGEEIGDNHAATAAGTTVDNSSTQNQIILPVSYVSDMGYGSPSSLVGKPVVIGVTDATGQQSTVTATVVGIQPKVLFGNQPVTVNMALANRLYTIQSTGLPAASVGQYPSVLAVFPSNLSSAQIQSIKDALSAKGYDAQTLQDAENTIFTVVNVIIIVLDTFAGITLLAASFGIINTLYMAVQERTKEIGLMKALGMSRAKIFSLFSIEAILIGFWGSTLGVLVAALLGNVIDSIAKNGFLKNVSGLTLLTFPLSTILSVIGGIMLLAFLAGTLPALRASKKNPIDALRYE